MGLLLSLFNLYGPIAIRYVIYMGLLLSLFNLYVPIAISI